MESSCAGCNEHYLLHIMRACGAFIRELDIVAEIDGEIVGNIVYTKAKILGDDGINSEVLSFGPVSALPSFWAKKVLQAGNYFVFPELLLRKMLRHEPGD